MAAFRSILFIHASVGRPADAPDCLVDLHLDDIISSVVVGDTDGDLRALFYLWARDVDEVTYRHEVFRDLFADRNHAAIEEFVDNMREVTRQRQRAAKLWHPLQRHGWSLYAMEIYCRALAQLRDTLSAAELASRGMRDFRDHLDDHLGGPEFIALDGETDSVRDELAQIRYSVHIKGLHVEVDNYHGEPDYSDQLAQLFERFRHEGGRDYRVALPDYPDMNHVEEQILDRVAALHPKAFERLAQHCARYEHFIDQTLQRFASEVRFYISYLAFMRRCRRSGASFCYPKVSGAFSGIYAEDTYDLALASSERQDDITLVPNDLRLTGRERVLIITGPNQGGKTTFARTFGQLCYLGALGCPVPARRAALMLPDRIFTHFERQEQVASLHGKLDDELVRIYDVLARTTSRSVIVMNESFSSTTLSDAVEISTDVILRIIEIGCVTVYVSFLDELSRLHPACVSIVGGVEPNDPTVRTFRFTRQPANGLAYAAALADKYGLSPEILQKRLNR